jgi:hypothetical protein
MHSTIHNFCSAPRRWLSLNWLLVLPLLAASAQFLAAAPARANPPGEAAAAAELPFALYITMSMKDVDEAGAVEQASVLENHRAILKCTALNPGKTYRTVWSLKDAGGHELVTRPELGFTATDSHQWVPNIYFRPDRLPQDGQWTWRVTVEGQGTFSKQITILPPTKDEAETLASFQQVRENVLHAFSLSWRFYDGCYFTVVDAGSPDETLLQVTNLLAPHFTPERVSPADKLNGFSYRSKATFGFEVWRQFTSAGGWTEWQNTKEHDSDLSEAYAHFLTANVPESFKTNFNLGFAAYIKDGHCRLLADDGTEFVDRRQNSNAKRFAKCPSKPFVQKALREGGSLRKSEQAAVETLRARPETTVDGSKETTDAIRALMGPGSSFLWQNNVPAPSFPR